MNIRFGAKQIEALCDGVRKLVDAVRSHEREIMDLCVDKAKMPRHTSSRNFQVRKQTCAGPANRSCG
jgi:RNA polymerase primary sigma factor